MLLNATMSLAGMVPAAGLDTVSGPRQTLCFFLCFYAGLVFLILAGVPWRRCFTGFCTTFTWRWWMRMQSPGDRRQATGGSSRCKKGQALSGLDFLCYRSTMGI